MTTETQVLDTLTKLIRPVAEGPIADAVSSEFGIPQGATHMATGLLFDAVQQLIVLLAGGTDHAGAVAIVRANLPDMIRVRRELMEEIK
jgi:hypothetical protein